MAVRAEFQSSFLRRYLLIAVTCGLCCAWFLYDGVWGYPQQLQRRLAYDELAERLQDDELNAAWRELVAAKGWPRATPDKKAEDIEHGIQQQYFWAAITGLICAIFVAFYFRSRRAWVEQTEQGLSTSWGQSVDFSQVQRLDKRKWRTKGLAYATYQDAGRKRVYTFDDFKYAREPLGMMLKRLEQHLRPDQIVGGPPEATRPNSEATAATSPPENEQS